MSKKCKLCFLLICIFGFVFVATGCGKQNYESNSNMLDITINIYDKQKLKIYSNDLETNKEYLSDVLDDLADDIQLKKEIGDYGTYIVSLMGIDQGDGYYWIYYIGDKYASIGVSEYEIKDGEIYNFYIEKYE